MARADRRGHTFFEELYAIIVGLGLAFAVEQVIDLGKTGLPIRAEHVPIFFAYLNLAFALAHSSVRYLQLAYDEQGVVLDRTRIVADLFLGVGQFLFLIALSLLITRPALFTMGAILLLVGRPLRDLVLKLRGHQRLELDRRVARLHITVILILASALGLAQISMSAENVILGSAAVVASIVFGLGLYVGAFDFFFPTTNAGGS